jgi:pimeloyl-ACP methyl ester carboxylesterase
MQRSDFSAFLESIHCPVRVLCGQEDRVTPVPGNRFLAEHIPGATLEVVQGAGHLLPVERPMEVTRFLRGWLEGPAPH